MSETVATTPSAILDTWSDYDWSAGVQIDLLQKLHSLTVRTRNSTYDITVLDSRTGEVLVRGGKYFPRFTRARLAGSSMGGSFLKLLGIYVGFRMEIHLGPRAIVTSPVQSIEKVTALPS